MLLRRHVALEFAARISQRVASLPCWARLGRWLCHRAALRDDLLLGEAVIFGLGVFFAHALTPESRAAWASAGAVLGVWTLARWASAWSVPAATLGREAARTLASLALAAAASLAFPEACPLWQGPGQAMFLFWSIAGILVYRLLAWPGRNTRGAGAENIRWLLVLLAGAGLMAGFARTTLHGTADAGWYATMLADTVGQVRAGVFPVWLGQTEYQFNGAIYPIRVAPAFHYIGAGLDLLTWRSLGIFALQNLQTMLIGMVAIASAYACLRQILPARRWTCAGLAFLFLACPGVVGMSYNTDLLMSWTTVPWVPVVWLMTVRFLRGGADGRDMILWGLALGMCWWGHSPIALWLSIFSGACMAVGLFPRRAFLLRLGPAVLGGAALGLTAAYPVFSVLCFPPESGVNAAGFQKASASTVMYFLSQAFPGVLRPVSRIGRELSDFQLGWALWLALAAALYLAARLRRRDAIVLASVPALIAILLTPWPRFGQMLWQAVPDFVRDTTGNWVMNRLYLVLASSVVFSLAAALSSWRGKSGLRRWPFCMLFLAALAWSGWEARKFAIGSIACARPIDTAESQIRLENNTLTRFAYNIFPGYPSSFTHGVMDGSLEYRILEPDMKTMRFSGNAEARAIGRPVAEADYVPKDGLAVQDHPFRLEHGQHYVLDFAWMNPPAARGTLTVIGSSLFRIYDVPEYGFARSFGVGGGHAREMPIWTSLPGGENFSTQLNPADGPAQLDHAFPLARLTLVEYDAEKLSTFVRMWIPYRATVRLTRPGWLETPRMYQESYVARVDGRRVSIAKSPDGLVAIPVPAGVTNVELKFKPPLGLEAIFWTSFLGIAALLAFASGAFLLSRFPGHRAAASA